MAAVKVVFVMLISIAVMASPMTEAITCGQVAANLAPCMSYLTGPGNPTAGCCTGVKNLLSSAQTTQDKQTVCNCLKSTASKIPNLNQSNAENLPGKCGIKIPYKISTSTNCATIKF